MYYTYYLYIYIYKYFSTMLEKEHQRKEEMEKLENLD